MIEPDSAPHLHKERNRLLSLISSMWPASLERHVPDNDDWPNDLSWVVIIDLPGGQISWHIEDSELELFDHLRRNKGRVWDGHLDQVKYSRIETTRKMTAWGK
jgi:hypothetical protein